MNYTNVFYSILDCIDYTLKELLKDIDKKIIEKTEEIRLRVGKPLIIHSSEQDYYVDNKGIVHKMPVNLNKSYIVTSENIYKSFEKISNYSIYSIQEELKQGFITIKGGHRIGIAGKGTYSNGKLDNVKNISSINIRIAREIIGSSNRLIKYIIKDSHTIYNTLIISPPKCGKTTILRDLIRNVSNGISRYNFEGLKVGVVDERSELASMYNGQPQNDLGYRTDVLDNFYKYDGMAILLRSMSPDVIATDELGHPDDINAIYNAIKSGVKVISTAHGKDLDDAKTRPNLGEIINENIFERIIILDNSKGTGTISQVLDGKSHKSVI